MAQRVRGQIRKILDKRNNQSGSSSSASNRINGYWIIFTASICVVMIWYSQTVFQPTLFDTIPISSNINSVSTTINITGSSSSSLPTYSEPSAQCIIAPSERLQEPLNDGGNTVSKQSTEKIKPEIVPPIVFGSHLGEKAVYHAGADALHFQLIRRHFEKGDGRRIMLDIGANQGYYTYYSAGLGYDEIHSIEMNPSVFRSLRHGQLYNSRGDRVYLHMAGVSDSIRTQSMSGAEYEGFLSSKKGKDGVNIQVLPLDCFVPANIQPSSKWDQIDFVKIDTEGFEISTISGAHITLFRYAKVIFIEVGPHRWRRSGKKLEEGINELQQLALAKPYSYIFLRGDKACPLSLRPEKNGISVENDAGAQIVAHRISNPDEWRELLTTMHSGQNDCNFWFANYPLEGIV